MIIKEKFMSACIGTLFFVVFQPFGISTFGMPERLLIPFGVLVVAFASCLTSESIVNYVLRMPMVADSGPSYFLTSSKVQEDDTTSKNSTHCPSQLITLEGSTKESVTLLPSDFLFAESEGNYVSIHYIDGGEANQAMLRTSMKNVIAILCENKDIMQCHRAYIVNLRHVESVKVMA